MPVTPSRLLSGTERLRLVSCWWRFDAVSPRADCVVCDALSAALERRRPNPFPCGWPLLGWTGIPAHGTGGRVSIGSRLDPPSIAPARDACPRVWVVSGTLGDAESRHGRESAKGCGITCLPRSRGNRIAAGKLRTIIHFLCAAEPALQPCKGGTRPVAAAGEGGVSTDRLLSPHRSWRPINTYLRIALSLAC